MPSEVHALALQPQLHISLQLLLEKEAAAPGFEHHLASERAAATAKVEQNGTNSSRGSYLYVQSCLHANTHNRFRTHKSGGLPRHRAD